MAIFDKHMVKQNIANEIRFSSIIGFCSLSILSQGDVKGCSAHFLMSWWIKKE